MKPSKTQASNLKFKSVLCSANSLIGLGMMPRVYKEDELSRSIQHGLYGFVLG